MSSSLGQFVIQDEWNNSGWVNISIIMKGSSPGMFLTLDESVGLQISYIG